MNTQGGFLITRIKQVGGRVFERILSEKKIDAFNGAQGRILYVLWQKDGVPISTLSRETGLATTTLTSMLDRMEATRLIVRDRGDRDRRKVMIYLTEAARGWNGNTTLFQRKSAISTTKASPVRRSPSLRATWSGC